MKKSASIYPGYSRSPRLEILFQKYLTDSAEARKKHGDRLYFDDDELNVYGRAVLRAYQETQGLPFILRRARALEYFASEALIQLSPEDLIAGSQRFCAFRFPPLLQESIFNLGYAHNAGHLISDYGTLVKIGLGGLNDRVIARLTQPLTEEGTVMLKACECALTAFAKFIQRHSEAAAQVATRLSGVEAQAWNSWSTELAALRQHPPTSFRGALQLVWFAQIFLHAENPTAAISFGRLDQYLWPYLRTDLDSKLLDLPAAKDLVAAFFLRCCEGEESQNLTLGGVDENGQDATNPLSFLLLEVMGNLRVCQPSLSVRLHPDSPDDLVRAACTVAVTGTGQPGFINDTAVIPGLQRLAIPLNRARDYGIVGCYEPTTPGDSYPNTVCGIPPDLVETLVTYLQTPEALNAPDFPTFLEGWFGRFTKAYQEVLGSQFQNNWNFWSHHAPSPFGSVMMQGCIEKAQPLESGGTHYNLFGVNIVGLGTIVDSLHVIRHLVFENREMTLLDLSKAISADFPDETLRRRLFSVPGRYGTDTEATNLLASQVSERIATLVLESRMDHEVRPYPGFFRFTADILSHPYATPDGRRIASPLSYGCGPTSACGGTPTSILASASAVAHPLCPCGNPLALSLLEKDFKGTTGVDRLAALVRGYFARGGFHLHVNFLQADALRAAQAEPTEHRELTIRISGLSTKFVTLTKPLQTALIERAEHGV